jgi:hypothetical protein
MRGIRPRAALWAVILLWTCALWPARTSQATDEKPLTEEQVKQLAEGPLKKYPDEIVKLVESHGVDFLPTNTSLTRLKDTGVKDVVLSAIRQKAGSQLRIKVCLFKGSGSALTTQFADAMVRRLIDRKVVDIAPFGSIPLDRTVGPPEGFDDRIKPEPNTLYILLEGWIRTSPSGLSVEPTVVYRDTQGVQHSIPGAEHPPSSFTRQTLDPTAESVVDWGIETAKKYAAS